LSILVLHSNSGRDRAGKFWISLAIATTYGLAILGL
jgi:hypothetical protein